MELGLKWRGFFPSNSISVIYIRITSRSDFKQAVKQEYTLGLASSPFLTYTSMFRVDLMETIVKNGKYLNMLT